MQTWEHSGTKTRAEDELRAEQVRLILTENTSHVFHFSDPGALRNVLPFPISARYPQACDAVARGVRVRIADLTGQPIFGPFIKEPEIISSTCPFPYYRTLKPIKLDLPTFSFLITPDGALKESKVTNSSGSPVLDQAVRTALSTCKFKPLTIDDEPAQEATWLPDWQWLAVHRTQLTFARFNIHTSHLRASDQCRQHVPCSPQLGRIRPPICERCLGARHGRVWA